MSGAVTSQSAGISGTITLPSGSVVSYSGGSSLSSPQIQPSSQAVNAGANVTLSVIASGAIGYQWLYEGSNIVGATGSTLTISNIGAYQAGVYTVAVTTSSGTVTSAPATVAVNVSAHLVNLSARAFVGTGSQALVAGFVVNGSNAKQVLVRGLGPTLAQFSVAGPLASTSLTLFDSSAAVIATNTGWGNAVVPGSSSVGATVQAATSSLFNQLYAVPIPAGSADSALVATLPPGVSYTAQVSGVGGGTGVALAELYDVTLGGSGSHLSNISGRAFVGTGSQVEVVGFSISGTTAQTVLLRGVGPTLAQYGISSPLVTPQLVLYDSQGLVIASNTGWGTAPQKGLSSVAAGIASATTQIMSQVYAFALPANSADCAMLVTLPPGTYTAQLSGVNGATGVALVETYDVP